MERIFKQWISLVTSVCMILAMVPPIRADARSVVKTEQEHIHEAEATTEVSEEMTMEHLPLYMLPPGRKAALSSAQGTHKVSLAYLDGTYYHSSAFALLELLNERRRDSDRGELTMDQALLETAMTRAAELVVTFEHDRPNGEEFYSAFPEGYFLNYSLAEELFISTGDPEALVQTISEETIRSTDITRAGIGCFRHGRYTYWALILASGDCEPARMDPDGDVTVAVDLGEQDYEAVIDGSVLLQLGESQQLQMYLKNRYHEKTQAYLNNDYVQWSSENSDVVSVEKGLATALTKGRVIITAACAGQSAQLEMVASDGGCPHEWDTETLSTSNSCTEYGEMVYWCRLCDLKLREKLYPMEHSYVNAICTRCGDNLLEYGTEDAPYKIDTAEEFVQMMEKPDLCYRLMADITLDTYRTPQNFSGQLDGNGHTITNPSDWPIFSTLEDGAVVRDLNVKLSMYAPVNETVEMGGICAINNGLIEDCLVKGAVYPNSTSINMAVHLGGICGVNYGTIRHCKNEAHFSFSGVRVNFVYFFMGGIAGRNFGTVTDCWNDGDIVLQYTEDLHSTFETSYCGGIVGTGEAVNCAQSGDILQSYQIVADPDGYMHSGFITGDEFESITSFWDKTFCENGRVSQDSDILAVYIYQDEFYNEILPVDSPYTIVTDQQIRDWFYDPLPAPRIPRKLQGVRQLTDWDAEKQIAYFDGEFYPGSAVTNVTDTSFLPYVEDMLGGYVFAVTETRADGKEFEPRTLLSLQPVTRECGTITDVTDRKLTVNGSTYSYRTSLFTDMDWYEGRYAAYYLLEDTVVGLESLAKPSEQVLIESFEDPTLLLRFNRAQANGFDISGTQIHTDTGNQKVIDDIHAITYDDSEPEDITVTCDGCLDYIIPGAVVSSMIDESPLAYLHDAYLYLEPELSAPYISTVFGRISGSNEPYKELRTSKLKLTEGTLYDIIVTGVGFSDRNVVYCIGQNDAHKISNSTGVFEAVDLYKILDFSEKVYAYALDLEQNIETRPQELRIEKEVTMIRSLASLFDMKELSVLDENWIEMKIPDEFPLVGGMTLGLDDFHVPLGVALSGPNVWVSFGLDIFASKKEIGSPAEYKTVYEQFASLVDAHMFDDDINKIQEAWALMCDDGDILKKTPSVKKCDFDLDFVGFMQGEIVNGELVVKEFTMRVKGGLKFQYHQQVAIWVVPAYFYVEGGADFAVGPTYSRELATLDYPLRPSFSLNITPNIKLGGGLGVDQVVSGGIYGTGSLPFSLDTISNYYKLEMAGEFGIEGKFFILEGRKELLKGRQILLEGYFGPGKKNSANATASMLRPIWGETVTRVADREYLTATSEWLGDRGPALLLSQETPAAQDALMETLQTNVYEMSQAKIATSDGRTVMVWVEDDPSRDTYNRLRLVYSEYDEQKGTWTEGRPVWDDGHNDAYPYLTAEDGEIYLVWQKLGRKLTAADCESVDALMESSEICFARFDPASGTFTDECRITNDQLFDYAPAVTVENGRPAVYYASCKLADAQKKGGHTLNRWTAEDGVSAAARELQYVQTIAAQDGCVSILMDGDGDMETVNDVNAFTLEKGALRAFEKTVPENALSMLRYGTLNGEVKAFVTDGANIYYEDRGQTVTILPENRQIEGNLDVVTGGGRTTVLWTELNGTSNDLYAATWEDGAWSEAVKRSSFDCMLTDGDIAWVDGSLLGVGNAAEVTFDETLQYHTLGRTDLCAFRLQGYADLAIEPDIFLEEHTLQPGTKAPMLVTVSNHGTERVSEVTFRLQDSLGTDITVVRALEVPAGGSAMTELDYPVPGNYAAGTLTVQVSGGDGDLDPDNNTAQARIGQADLAVCDPELLFEPDQVTVSMTITNRSAVTAEDVVLDVILNETDGEIYESVRLDDLDNAASVLNRMELSWNLLELDENGTGKVYFRVSASNDPTGDLACCVVTKPKQTVCAHPVIRTQVAVPATCTTHGYTEGTECEACGSVIKSVELVEALGHEITYTVTQIPNSDSSGKVAGHCSQCGLRTEMTIPNLDSGEYLVTTSGSSGCAGPGIRHYVWTNTAPGRIEFEVEIDEIGHDYACSQENPTCTEDGVIHYTCRRCGDAYDQVIPAAGHAYQVTERKDASCTEDGFVEQVCSVCGEKNRAVIEAQGHSWQSWKEQQSASGDTPGIKTRTCKGCGTEETTQWTSDLSQVIGQCAGGMSWEIRDGVLTFRGSGPMEDYRLWLYAPWYDYSDLITQVRIADGVTSVGDRAFYEKMQLTRVELGADVQTIGEYAFYKCAALETVTGAGALTKIGPYAFYLCEQLQSIVLADTLREIQEAAFAGCFMLKSLELPEALQIIGDNAFEACWLLEEVTIPAGVRQLGIAAYLNCESLTTVRILAQLEAIPDAAFEGCTALKELILPNSVRVIGIQAFSECAALESVDLPSNLNRIEDAAFYRTSLKQIVIPEGVTQLGKYAFLGTMLTDITIPASLQYIGTRAFYEARDIDTVRISDLDAWVRLSCEDYYATPNWSGAQIYLNGEPLKEAVIADDVGSIREQLFEQCKSLEKVVLPEGIVSIGQSAFAGTALTEVVIPKSVVLGTGVFSGCKNLFRVTLPEGLEHLPDSLFSGCTSLRSIELPAGLKTMGESALSESGLETLVIPRGVKVLPKKLFYNCGSLTSVNLPQGLTTIGEETFGGCSALTGLELPETVTELDWGSFRKSGLTSLKIPDGVTALPEYLLYSSTDLIEVELPEALESIGAYALFGCDALEQVELPESLTTIGTRAFSQSGLKKLVIPEGVTGLSEYMVGFCEQLTSVTLPRTLTSIGNYTFAGCTALEALELPESLTAIGEGAFAQSGLRTLEIPRGVAEIPEIMLYSCRDLTSMEIHPGITQIGSGAFQNCSQLSLIRFLGDAPEIAGDAFRSVDAYALYPEGNATWTEEKLAGYGGTIEWYPGSTLEDLDPSYSGTCGTSLSWTYEDHVLTITGAGAMTQYYASNLPWRKVKPFIRRVEISEGVTSLSSNAVSGCTALEHITIPASLKMSKGILSGCTALKTAGPIGSGCNIEIGWTEEVPAGAFYGLTFLEEVRLPDSIIRVGENAFGMCTSLERVILPEQIQQIDTAAFDGCGNLSYVRLGAPTKITDDIFGGCEKLKSAGPLGSGCSIEFSWTEELPNDAFWDADFLERVTLPEGLKTIGNYALGGCDRLTAVVIPDTVTTIKSYAFYNSDALAELTLPARLESLQYEAFYGCDSLARVHIGAPAVVGEGVFRRCPLLKSAGPEGSGSSIEFGWTETIPEYAFYGAGYLESVIIPETVTTLGEASFAYCGSLQEIRLPDSIEVMEPQVFLGCTNLSHVVLNAPASMAHSIFKDCSLLKSAGPLGSGCNIEFGWTDVIPNRAFYSANTLEQIIFPDSITLIEEYALGCCYLLTHVELVEPAMEKGVFYCCDLLETAGPAGSGCNIEFGWTTEIPAYAFFESCVKEVELPDTIQKIGGRAFAYCEELTEATVPVGASVGAYAFAYCAKLASVRLGDRSTYSSDCFYNCPLLETAGPVGSGCAIEFDWTDTIPANAFNYHRHLKRVTIPANITDIGNLAFSNCRALEEIWFEGDAPTFGSNAFNYVEADAYFPAFGANWMAVMEDSRFSNINWIPYGQGEPVGLRVVGQEWYPTRYVGEPVIQEVYLVHDSGFELPVNLEEVTVESCDFTVSGWTSVTVTWGEYTGSLRILVHPQDTVILERALYPESPHDYPNSYDNTQTITQPYATKLWLTFSAETSVENGYDHIYILDGAGTVVGTYTGQQLAGKTICVEGDTAAIRLVTDGSQHKFGYSLDRVLALTLMHEEVITAGYPATCTEEGLSDQAYCTICECVVKEAEVIPAAGHAWDAGTVTTEPTEEDAGEMTYTCLHCGVTRTEPIPATGHIHSYEAAVVPPICTDIGYTVYTCSCGDQYLDDFTEALGHLLGHYASDGNASCTRDGTKTARCERCFFTDTVADPGSALGHSFRSYSSNGDATCTEDGTKTALCDRCTETDTVADEGSALGHVFTDWAVIQPPTNAEEGIKMRSCTRCAYTEYLSIPKQENPFTDVDTGSFYYEPIMWAVENGITNGTTATTFGPNDQCLRAQVVTFLWRAVGSPEPSTTDNPFMDVKPDDFYYKSVLWALENGITSGMDATHFGPMSYCNRAQVVTFLYRTLGSPEVSETNNPFTDVAAGSFYERAVLWAVENGITNGLAATSFGPNAVCNRAQIVTFLYRAFN